MHIVLETLGLSGIVPVVVIEDETQAVPLAEALLAGGLHTMEITIRSAAALNSIGRIAKGCPRMLTGAETVLTVDQVKAAIDVGARYIVSPGLNPKVVEYCLSAGVPVIPGVATPSEIEVALGFGLEVVKFFPAEANGGIDYLKAIAAPYKALHFIPTGGIDETNLLRYLKFPSVHACGGSWMVKADLLTNKRFDEITKLTGQAVATMLGFQLHQAKFPVADPKNIVRDARDLAALLRWSVQETDTTIAVGRGIEFEKGTGLMQSGQFGISTHFIDRAIAYFASQGVAVREETRVQKNGKTVAISLDRTFGGIALRLQQA